MEQLVKDLIEKKRERVAYLEMVDSINQIQASIDAKDSAVAKLMANPELSVLVKDRGAAHLMKLYGFKVKRISMLARFVLNTDGYDVSVPDRE